VFNGFPYIVIYTDNVTEGSAGRAKAFVVKIRPEYKDDIGLEFHEATHSMQFWKLGPFFHTLRYALSKSYKLKAEVEAYRKQLEYQPANGSDAYRRIYAGFISKDYNLGISEEEAYMLLK